MNWWRQWCQQRLDKKIGIVNLHTWKPPSPAESCIETDTAYPNSIAQDEWLRSSPLGGVPVDLSKGQFSIITAWHHDASAPKNAHDMASMGAELKKANLVYSHIWRAEGGRQFPAFAVHYAGIEDLIGNKISAEEAARLFGTPTSEAGNQVLPSEVAVTQAALNDYLERKAQPPSPQIQAKRARLPIKLSELAKNNERLSKPTYSFLLQSGRRVWLNAFHFDQMYAGLIIGLPNNAPGYILEQKTKAQVIWGSRPTYTIPPATIIREQGARQYESFPWFCYKAWLTSDELDSQNAGSELIVIWFAEEPMELSLITTVEQACRDVPWEQYAQDWNF